MYVGQYRKYYPSETRQQVWEEISMEEGYAMIAVAMSLDGWLAFSGVKVEGFIKSEVEKLMKEKKL